MCTTVDINECEGYNDCHQNCTNSDGSYYCSCGTGFVLAADNRTCQGYHHMREVVILFLAHAYFGCCYCIAGNFQGIKILKLSLDFDLSLKT